MLAALAFVVLLVAFATISWATRNAERHPRCCQPGAWPPDDITERASQARRRHEIEQGQMIQR